MSRKNILVVDDEKAQREILEMILTTENYSVTTASSGEAA
jgi:CheY-like chemotaxis protein